MNDLPAALDLAVFEQLPNGRFHFVDRMPGWWRMIAGQSDSEHGIDLCEHFPLLELFSRSAWCRFDQHVARHFVGERRVAGHSPQVANKAALVRLKQPDERLAVACRYLPDPQCFLIRPAL